MLLSIASTCIVMVAACLRAPVWIDASSSGGSVGLAVAQSDAARIGWSGMKSGMKSEKELSRRVDAYSRGKEDAPEGRAKLHPVTA